MIKLINVDGKKMFSIRDRFFGKETALKMIEKIDKNKIISDAILADLSEDAKLDLSLSAAKLVDATFASIAARTAQEQENKKEILALLPEAADDEVVDEK